MPIVEFFVESIYSKTIYNIRKIFVFFLFLHRGPMCEASNPDNGAILRVAL